MFGYTSTHTFPVSHVFHRVQNNSVRYCSLRESRVIQCKRPGFLFFSLFIFLSKASFKMIVETITAFFFYTFDILFI